MVQARLLARMLSKWQATVTSIHYCAIARNGSQYAEGLLDKSKGDTVIDYRKGVERTVNEIRSSLEWAGHELSHSVLVAAQLLALANADVM